MCMSYFSKGIEGRKKGKSVPETNVVIFSLVGLWCLPQQYNMISNYIMLLFITYCHYLLLLSIYRNDINVNMVLLNLPQNLWLDSKMLHISPFVVYFFFVSIHRNSYLGSWGGWEENEPSSATFFPFTLGLADPYWFSFESIFPHISNCTSTYLEFTNLVAL